MGKEILRFLFFERNAKGPINYRLTSRAAIRIKLLLESVWEILSVNVMRLFPQERDAPSKSREVTKKGDGE